MAWGPRALALAALLRRSTGPGSALAVATLAALALAAFLVRRLRRFERGWLARRLDATRRDLDDSSALLFADPARLSALQHLQRDRLEQRLRERPAPDLRPPWSLRAIVFAWLSLLGMCGLVALWPGARPSPAAAPAAPRSAQVAEAPRLLAQSLQVQPRGHTALYCTHALSLDSDVQCCQ